jgi:hypothetical protein
MMNDACCSSCFRTLSPWFGVSVESSSTLYEPRGPRTSVGVNTIDN